MKKRTIILGTFTMLVLMLLFASLLGSSEKRGQIQAEGGNAIVHSFTDRLAVIPQFQNAPVLDGMLDDVVWNGAWSGNGFFTMFNHERAASDTDLFMGYDESNLYVGIRGHYAENESDAETEMIEILLSPGKNAGNYHLNVPITRGPKKINPNWGADVSLLSQAQTELQHAENGWTLEIRIPFSAMDITSVQAGQEWGFNVIRHYGVNSNPFTSYVPLRNGYYNDTGKTNISLVVHAVNQNRMAPIYFSNLPNASTDSSTKQSLWNPESFEVIYTGFTTKDLIIQGGLFQTETELRMSWISPDGIESIIDEHTIARNKNSATISFQHPRPLKTGQYRLRLSFRNGNGAYQYFEAVFDRDAMIRAGDTQFQLADVKQNRMIDPKPASNRVQQLLELIPKNTGFIFVGLPEDPSLRPSSLFTWSASNPWQITAKSTGTVYPNDQYPEDKVLTVINPLGDEVEYPYYEDEEGKRYFLTAHLWYFQKDYVLRETSKLALTDPLGAARLLSRWAEVYQGYMPTNDYYWTNYPITTGPPYNYFGGVWYRWYTGDFSNLKHLVDAFGIVRRSNAFDILSDELGYDVEEYILEKLFKPSLEYVRSYPILSHNMEYHTWRGLIALSKATGDPSFMHEAVERIGIYAKDHYLFDGFWKEVTLSYHNQSTNGLVTSMNEAKGWSDPESYLSPRTGTTLDQLDLSVTFPSLNKSQTLKNVLAYPNGSYVPVQDTWAVEKTSTPYTSLGSYLLPASGIARIAQFAQSNPSQLYMMFTPKYGHNHNDPLNITLFAEGQEILPDIGYTHTNFRYWTMSTLAHNTVLVNSRDMDRSGDGMHGGQIESLIPVTDNVQIMKASQQSAYPMTDEYSREPWMIEFGGNEGRGYIVDIFRVTGGDRHEYTLGGDANRDGHFDTGITLEDYNNYLLPPGTSVKMPISETDPGSANGHYYGYIYVQDVQRADIPDGQLELTLVTEDAGQEQAKLSITSFVGEGNNELFIGKAPSLRATRLNGTSNDINTEADKYWMPKMVIRRSGSDLNSTFVTVMEPYNTDKIITNIEQLIPASDGNVALKVTYGNYTDIILSSADPSKPLTVEDMTLTGNYGFIRLHNGEISEMKLIGGTLLQKGDQQLTGTGPQTGVIEKVMRVSEGDPYYAFVTESTLTGNLAGHYLIVTHPDGAKHGYPIKEVTSSDGKTVILLDDTEPGWTINTDGTSKLDFYPIIEWTGQHHFRIDNVEER